MVQQSTSPSFILQMIRYQPKLGGARLPLFDYRGVGIGKNWETQVQKVMMSECCDERRITFLQHLVSQVKSLVLKVSWGKAKVQPFGGLLNDTIHYVHTCGETVTESFTQDFGSLMHKNGGPCQEVTRRISLAHGVMSSLITNIQCCWHLSRWTKIRIFKKLVLPASFEEASQCFWYQIPSGLHWVSLEQFYVKSAAA